MVLCSKLTGWESGSSDDGSAGEEEERAPSANARIVVLKHMFTLQELEEDATLLIDLKEEVREEAEGLGEVTSTTIFDVSSLSFATTRPSCSSRLIFAVADPSPSTLLLVSQKEEEGIMTVKFKDPLAARACVLKFNGSSSSPLPSFPRDLSKTLIELRFSSFQVDSSLNDKSQHRCSKDGSGSNDLVPELLSTRRRRRGRRRLGWRSLESISRRRTLNR